MAEREHKLCDRFLTHHLVRYVRRRAHEVRHLRYRTVFLHFPTPFPSFIAVVAPNLMGWNRTLT
jgi:hypothetical protein